MSVREAQGRLQALLLLLTVLCGSSPGSSQALALINSYRRCPAMADKGPPPPSPSLFCNIGPRNKQAPLSFPS